MGGQNIFNQEKNSLELNDLDNSLLHKLFLLDEHQTSVYRFFPEEWQADALTKGKVWLSTLNQCRAYEDPKQGDAKEAFEIYNSGYAVGGSNNPEFVERARRSGISIGPGCSNITISNNTSERAISDAYILCTTTNFSPEKLNNTFGNYCVEITDPRKFFIIVSNYLNMQLPIKQAVAGKVIYKDRIYRGLEERPGPIGFVKPPDLYAEQKEFRFLWIPNSDILNPFLLDCPNVSSLCKRID